MRKYFAEFLGTGVLVAFACGTATAAGCNTGLFNTPYLLTALAFGLVIVAMAYSVGRVSGCHINPAVSLAMLISGRMSVKDFIGYVVAQFLGAFGGAGIIGMLLGFNTSLGCNGLYGGNNIVLSLFAEIVLTFVFVFVILGVTSDEKYSNVAGLVIGLTLTLVHIFGIHFTGTSVNPARSFGPAFMKLLAGDGSAFSVVWVFIVAPLIGGALAALVWKLLAPKAE